ncbi:transglycosylase SLT domain-containing protein [Hydrogenophaga sp.]|uniref:transglycosylase SLT domain-containing protein n=1 Tax=Hydrogenophaga sp. TaxID=1904254 RepID=UPI003F6C2B64
MKTSPFVKRLLSCWAVLLTAAQPAHGRPQDAGLWREQARAYEHGEGVVRDIDTAMALYCKAAMAGDAEARYSLGWIYANGRGTERNDAYAAYFFQQAASLGDGPSQRMLNQVGPHTAKPPCVLAAEAVEQERLAQAQADAKAAAALVEAQRQSGKFEQWVLTPSQKHIMAIVRRLAPQYGIHPGLAFAVIRAESNFDPQTVSDKSAQGLMQLIPETAARFNVHQPLDPEQNIRGGLAYLRWLLAYFKGDVPLAVAAYNAGEGAVNRYGGVPPFKETQAYLRRIQEVFNLPEHPFDPRITAPSPMLSRPPLPPRL